MPPRTLRVRAQQEEEEPQFVYSSGWRMLFRPECCSGSGRRKRTITRKTTVRTTDSFFHSSNTYKSRHTDKLRRHCCQHMLPHHGIIPSTTMSSTPCMPKGGGLSSCPVCWPRMEWHPRDKLLTGNDIIRFSFAVVLQFSLTSAAHLPWLVSEQPPRRAVHTQCVCVCV